MTTKVVRPASTSVRTSVPCSRSRKKPSRPPPGTPGALATALFCLMVALHHAGVGRRFSAGLPAILCGGIARWEEAARRLSTVQQYSSPTIRSSFSDSGVQLAERVLGVAEKHRGLRVVEEHVLDPGKPRAPATLQYIDRLRLVDIQNRHPVDWAARIVAGGRVRHVVGTSDDGDVSVGEVLI